VELSITQLQSGGLITNYVCSSTCKHCLYGSSPHWQNEYISQTQAICNIRKIKELGCHAIHIGGGEPFLWLEGLIHTLQLANEEAITIDYVETNSSWYQNHDQAISVLRDLQDAGLGCILVSISPFHNEHIPLFKVEGVMDAAAQIGMSVFPWVEHFIPELRQLDPNRKHSLAEWEDHFGDGYVSNLPSRYWITMGGRAALTYRDYLPQKPLDQILSSSAGGCSRLLDTSHFHVDLFGTYIPGLCSGLGIALENLGKPLDPQEYPLLTMLYSEGIQGLFKWATEKHYYKPKASYIGKCELCLDIRMHLVLQTSLESKELTPHPFYLYVQSGK
jgi:hypothetical protein